MSGWAGLVAEADERYEESVKAARKKQRHGPGGYRAKPSGENPHDFFPTPEPVTRAFLDACPLPTEGLWCEPACGEGHIVRATGARRWATIDIRDVPAPDGVECHLPSTDFLKLDLPPGSFDVIITNPPFYLAEEFVRKALSCATHVAMLLRLAFLETRKREPLHREHPSDVYVLTRRPSFLTNGATDTSAYAWFVWGPGRGGRWFPLRTPETNKPKKKGAA